MRNDPAGLLRPVCLAAAFGLAALGGALLMPISAPAQNVQVDLDSIFRCTATDAERRAICAEGRELILVNCTVCHTFAPIVLQQFDENGWRGLLDRHRVMTPQLTEAQFETMWIYLTANFNPQLEPPALPDALLKTWTDY